MAKKPDDSLLSRTERSDKYNERTSSKKYLAKKRRIHDKISGVTLPVAPGETWDSMEHLHVSRDGSKIGVVTGFKYSSEGKIIEIFELTTGESLETILDKSLPKSLEWDLVVGDKVAFIQMDGVHTIINREKRVNCLARFRGDADRPTLAKRERHVIAANLDYVVIVAAAKNPSFHPNLVDRYLILCQNGWVTPLICITKSDLAELKHPILDWYEKELGAKVIMTSNQTEKGIEELKETLAGKTCVLVGNSGVWKSTITNLLLWSEVEETGRVGKKTWQGRHTTTASHVYKWAKDSCVIDTPWIRSLEIFEIPQNELRFYFEEFDQYTQGCRYWDCSHTHEPECGVKFAVENGLINRDRYESYIRMYDDLV